MSLQFKARPQVSDIVLAALFRNFLPPVSFVWGGLFLILFYRSDILRFFRDGQFLWFAAACSLLLLQFAFAVALVNLLVLGLAFLLGRFRTALLEQDISIEDEFLTCRTAESDYRIHVLNVLKFAETPNRVIWHLPGWKVNAFSKEFLTPEQLAELRVEMRWKTSSAVPFITRFWIPALIVLAVFAIWGMMTPEYSVQTTSENMQAFWREDVAVISIPVFTAGRKVGLLKHLYPSLARRVNRHAEADLAPETVENHVFIIRNGRLIQSVIRGGLDVTLGMVRPVGDDLLLFRYLKGRQEFSRFSGDNFAPVTEAERDEILKRLKENRPNRSGWKAFGLWDEGTEEEEDSDDDQQYRATVRMKPSDLTLGMDVTWVERKDYAQDKLYTLKGLNPDGTAETLMAVEGKFRKVGWLEYRKLFPKEAAMVLPIPESAAKPAAPSDVQMKAAAAIPTQSLPATPSPTRPVMGGPTTAAAGTSGRITPGAASSSTAGSPTPRPAAPTVVPTVPPAVVKPPAPVKTPPAEPAVVKPPAPVKTPPAEPAVVKPSAPVKTPPAEPAVKVKPAAPSEDVIYTEDDMSPDSKGSPAADKESEGKPSDAAATPSGSDRPAGAVTLQVDDEGQP